MSVKQCLKRCYRTRKQFPILGEIAASSMPITSSLGQVLSQYKIIKKHIDQIKKLELISDIVSNLDVFQIEVNELKEFFLELKSIGKIKKKDTEFILRRLENCNTQAATVVANLSGQSTFSRQSKREMKKFMSVCKIAIEAIKKYFATVHIQVCQKIISSLAQITATLAVICINAFPNLSREVPLLSSGQQTGVSANGVYLLLTENRIDKIIYLR